MKKLIAIIFLTLLCLATVSTEANPWDTGYELIADGESAEKEKKDNKKEAKEFTANPNNPYGEPSFISSHKIFKDLIFPHPAPGKITPPPDPAC